MEINLEELNQFILTLFHEYPPSSNSKEEIKSEPDQSCNAHHTVIPTKIQHATEYYPQQNQEQLPINPTSHVTNSSTTLNDEKNYYFIIFSNARWSRILRNKTLKIPSLPTRSVQQKCQATQQSKVEHNSQQQQQQQQASVAGQSSIESINNDDLDNWFVGELSKLINVYIERTKRPFPMKYFLDLTYIARSS